MAFPQYAKTNHPAVIEAIRETHRRDKEFIASARELSEKLTGEPDQAVFVGDFWVGQQMVGIHRNYADMLNEHWGRWKKPKGIVVEPYKNNPIYDEVQNVAFEAADIPGRENLIWGRGRVGTGVLWESDGWVYSGIGFSPERDYPGQEEYGWQEILTSEFYLEMEKENTYREILSEQEA